MEYPGAMLVGKTSQRNDILQHHIVHEIAHQWFYGVVSNDPYYHAWLDEGITAFATALFFASYDDNAMDEIISAISLKELEKKPSIIAK
ncbi:MAG: M1 family aminopeptidase [Ectobacillus sp.]